jgi:heat shock protein HtpX
MSFSRRREYHADAGAAQMMQTPTHMIAALRKLDTAFSTKGYQLKNNATANLMIFGELRGMLRSHPTVEQRIAALESGQYVSGV